ncbi:hypothetical protein GGR21_002960 [Dysgonomonas hofstadii]|uniref:Uncharacterized protein n=1 Tax=Dysgonomonas hofstadii TaxID=637886 RepID=A0A840CNR9_9BACT|nr:hypothetical protein [Dysgonomonas hofstadii]
MELLFFIFPIVAISVISLWLGNTLSIRLPEINRVFNRKPFNCRPCFTFHLTWLLSLIYTLISNDELFIFISILISFALFFLTKYIDNKKITK